MSDGFDDFGKMFDEGADEVQQASEVEGVFDQLHGFVHLHAFLLAKLTQQLCVLFGFGVVFRVDECGLIDVCQVVFLG